MPGGKRKHFVAGPLDLIPQERCFLSLFARTFVVFYCRLHGLDVPTSSVITSKHGALLYRWLIESGYSGFFIFTRRRCIFNIPLGNVCVPHIKPPILPVDIQRTHSIVLVLLLLSYFKRYQVLALWSRKPFYDTDILYCYGVRRVDNATPMPSYWTR